MIQNSNLLQSNIQEFLKNGEKFLSEGDFLKALENYENVLKTGNPASDLVKTLGTLNKKLGRFKESLFYFEGSSQNIANENSIEMLRLLNNICEVQTKMARYEEANKTLESCKRLLNIIENEVGMEKCQFERIKIQRNEALLYGEMGDYKEALRLLDDLVDIVKQKDEIAFQREYAKILLSRSQIYIKFSRLVESRDDVEKCYDIVRNRMNSYPLLMVGALHTLAILDRFAGRELEVEINLQSAIEIGKQYLGEDHIEIARLYKHFGIIYLDKRELNQSLKMIETSYEIYLNKLGEEHPLTLSVYNNLGEFYADKGEYTKAEEIMKGALELRKKVVGENHPDVAESHFKLGELYSDEAKYSVSLNHLLSAKKILEKIYPGKDQLSIANLYNQMGIVYVRLLQLKTARKYLKESLRIKMQMLGKDNPEVAISYSNLGLLEGESGNIDRQISYYLKALKIQKKIFGKDGNELLITYHNLGVAYEELGDLKKALAQYKKALKIEHRAYGENHPLISGSYLSIGSIYQKQNKTCEAGKYILKSLKMASLFYEQSNLNTTDGLSAMGNLYNKLHNFKEAQSFYKKTYLIRRNDRDGKTEVDILQYVKETLYNIDQKKCLLFYEIYDAGN